MGGCCCLPRRGEESTQENTQTDRNQTTVTLFDQKGNRKRGASTPSGRKETIAYGKDDPWGRKDYVGEIIRRNNRAVRHGRGVLTWNDGRRYTGRFQEDMAHGEGEFSCLNDSQAAAALITAGKRVPTEACPDIQQWNYGVRCYHGSSNLLKGDMSRYADKDPESLPIFVLPFEPNYPRVLSSGPLGHREAGDGEYAWDYGMPVGSPVLATIGGQVLRYAQHFGEGRAEARFRGKDNFVVIRHDDGTLGTYCHLHQRSIKVQVHQRVEPGTVIGLSGNSGYTSGPHLHFHVAREVDPQMFIQIPGRFTGDRKKTFICDKVNVCYGADGPISDKYDGEYDENKLQHGTGILYRADGAVYTGQWNHGQMHGNGVLKYGETDRLDEYRGELDEGMRHGEGTLRWSDGREYTGAWRDNQINGEGTLKYTTNDQFKRREYRGQFLNDMRHGQGRLEWGDGRWYEGPWEHDAVVHRRQLC